MLNNPVELQPSMIQNINDTVDYMNKPIYIAIPNQGTVNGVINKIRFDEGRAILDILAGDTLALFPKNLEIDYFDMIFSNDESWFFQHVIMLDNELPHEEVANFQNFGFTMVRNGYRRAVFHLPVKIFCDLPQRNMKYIGTNEMPQLQEGSSLLI
jgi:hypothetical protein